MANQAMLIAGIIVLVIGIILIVIGIFLYESNLNNNRTQPFYVYLMLIGGLILAVIGGTILGFGIVMGGKKKDEVTAPPETENYDF